VGGVLRLGFLRPLKRPQGGLKQASRPTIEYGSATWPPRIVLAALSIAFGIAVLGAAVTTVRQLDLLTWHSADGQSRAAI